jgi:hypothetical protein
VLSSESEGSLDSFELLLLRDKLVALELDPSDFDAEGPAFFGRHKLTKEQEPRLADYLGENQTSNIHKGVVSPDFDTPSSANLLRKAARATKEYHNQWIRHLFIQVD